VDPDTQNITADSVQPVLTSRTRAMICVHLAGMPCEMDAIMDLAQEKGIFVIEDCAQAHGARYKGRSVGSIGHIGTWSFCQDKIMSTAGEGGMLTTNRIEWWQKVWSLKDHGRTSETLGELTPSTSFKWLYHMFGTNGRMLEIQAAIGRVQLGRMAAWHSIRLRHANKIRSTALQLTIFRVPKIPDHIEHAWYKCYLFVRNEMLKPGWNRDRVIDAIKQRGVPCYSGICPEVYLEEAFENTGFRPSQRLSVAEELGNTSMMLLVHPTLTDAEINKTCQALSEVAILATIENAFVKTRPTRLNR
jgi:dTDP-4-amino-4,6-dideoxygalactose transaminase